MTANELEDFLGTDDSKSVGDKGSGGESTGHQSGRRIMKILRAKKGDLTEDDAAHMRKVVGYVHRGGSSVHARPAEYFHDGWHEQSGL
jgi:hypothetical protein